VVDARRQLRIPPVVRRFAPWAMGGAILVYIVHRVPFVAFRQAIGHGPHLRLALTDLAVVIATLFTDALATWVGLIALRMKRAYWDVFAVRGATYVLSLVNYALGQGGFGVYLARSGATSLQAVGATLFLMGTNLATMLVMAFATSTLAGEQVGTQLWWTLGIGCAGYVLYLGIIVASPQWLARRETLAPLFGAKVRGHVAAMIGRLPHVLVMVLGIWVALRAWDIPVPLDVGMVVIPFVVIASAIPIAPAGLGTTQAVMVFFLSVYGAGATPDERSASLLAFAMVHFVYATISWLIVGFACVPFARRVDRRVTS
jgi:hypothetical protein